MTRSINSENEQPEPIASGIFSYPKEYEPSEESLDEEVAEGYLIKCAEKKFVVRLI